MAVTWLPRTTQSWSRLLGLSAIVLPAALYIWQAFEFSRWAESQDNHVCGMPLLAALVLAAFLSAVLSLLAFVVGLAGYRDLPRPRSGLRALELLLVGLPAMLLIIGLLVAMLSAPRV